MLAVAAATLAAFLISSVWYSVFGGPSEAKTPPWKVWERTAVRGRSSSSQ